MKERKARKGLRDLLGAVERRKDGLIGPALFYQAQLFMWGGTGIKNVPDSSAAQIEAQLKMFLRRDEL